MTSKEVKKIRESLGLSRVQFAKEIGASVRTIEAWETCIEPGGIGRAAIYALQSRKPALDASANEPTSDSAKAPTSAVV